MKILFSILTFKLMWPFLLKKCSKYLDELILLPFYFLLPQHAQIRLNLLSWSRTRLVSIFYSGLVLLDNIHFNSVVVLKHLYICPYIKYFASDLLTHGDVPLTTLLRWNTYLSESREGVLRIIYSGLRNTKYSQR